MRKTLLFCFSAFTLISSPALCSDEDLLRAALKKIEALDSRMSSLEAENKSLRAALNKNKTGPEKPQSRASVATRMPYSSNVNFPSNEQSNVQKSLPLENHISGGFVTNHWSGIYGGINAGYAVGFVNQYSHDAFGSETSGINFSSGSVNDNFIQGGAAGAQIGYNYSFTNKVLAGVEADIHWADINNLSSRTVGETYYGNTHALYVSPDGSGTAFNSYSRLGLNWYGTVRARLGYELGNFVPYITGGFAYGGLSQTISSSFNEPSTGYGSLSSGNNSIVSAGWALGAGAEYMVANNWSLKGEYLFTQLGGIATPVNYFSSSASTASSNTAGYTTYNSGTFAFHQFRLGLNYHTGWMEGDSTTIASKY